MTIASEIQRIQTNIANAYDALEAKGATMPATENTDNLVTTIDTISSGGDVVTATNNTGTDILAGDKVWINESSGNYNLISFSKDNTLNVQKYGSPTISSDFIGSDFTNSSCFISYQTLPLMASADRWEAVSKFKITSNSSYNGMIICQSTGNYEVNGFILFIGSDNKCYFQAWDESSTLIANITSSTTLSLNQWYWVKAEFTGTQYNLYISTDGTIWTNEGSQENSVKIKAAVNPFAFGTGPNSFYFHGQIDFKEVYFRINGGLYWSAVGGISYDINTNTLTGFAKEVIANGSTGEVLTLVEPKYYAYKDLLNRYVYCQNIITSTQYYYNLNARSDNAKATSISELTVPSTAKPASVSDTGAVTFNIMVYYRSEQDDLY